MNPEDIENDLLEPRKSKAFQRLEKKLTIDTLWLWVIRLLKDGPKYAYELRQEFEERFGFCPATVTNYTVLYLLEKEGIVERVESKASSIRLDRKYYSLTEFGSELFDEANKYFAEIHNKLFNCIENKE